MTITTCWIFWRPVKDADALRTPEELATTKLPTIAASNSAVAPQRHLAPRGTRERVAPTSSSACTRTRTDSPGPRILIAPLRATEPGARARSHDLTRSYTRRPSTHSSMPAAGSPVVGIASVDPHISVRYALPAGVACRGGAAVQRIGLA